MGDKMGCNKPSSQCPLPLCSDVVVMARQLNKQRPLAGLVAMGPSNTMRFAQVTQSLRLLGSYPWSEKSFGFSL